MIAVALVLATLGGAELEVRHARSGQPLVRAEVDGVEGWFVFDTGATRHVIDAGFAAALQLDGAGIVASRSPQGVSRRRVVEARTLVLGGIAIEEPSFVEYDLGALEPGMGTELAGILGYDLLARFVVEIDYRNGRIALRDPEPVDVELPWTELVVRDRDPCVLARVEGESVLMLLDTGSDQTAILSTYTTRRLGLLDDRPTRPAQMNNVDGTLGYRRGELASFELAGRSFADAPVLFATSDDGFHAERYPHGIVGCAFLEPFTVVLDCARSRVAFVPHPVPRQSERLLASLAGRYRSRDAGLLRVELDGSRLVLRPPLGGTVPLVPVGDGRELTFACVGRLERLTFERNEKDAITSVAFGPPGVTPTSYARQHDRKPFGVER